MQIPSNMLITRIKPGVYMSAWMLIWAVVSGCTALVQSFGGLVACRFFLGITEVRLTPQRRIRPVGLIHYQGTVLSRSNVYAIHILHSER
jgi:hypothetical protein